MWNKECCLRSVKLKFDFLLPSGLSSVQSLSLSGSLRPHGLQHARLPCPSPAPGAYSNSCSLSQWCHPTISSAVVPLSSFLQSFPASGSFQMSQFFASSGQSVGVSASDKGEKERYIHLNAEFQRIARRDKKAFLSNQCKEIEENNRMEKTGDLFKKIRDTKGILLWKPRQHIKKQRHYFANKCPSSQSYGFSSSHVWMWELDYKES